MSWGRVLCYRLRHPQLPCPDLVRPASPIPAAPYALADLRPEFDAYLEWVRQLQALSAQRNGMPVSKHYRAKGLVLYTRFGAAVVRDQACTALCLSSIDLSDARRGRGFFALLVGYLREHAPALGAQALTVESVLNERLAHWLKRHGFKQYGAWDESVLGNYQLRLTSSG